MKFYLIFFLSLVTSFNFFAQTQRIHFLEKAILDKTERRMFDDNSKEIYLHEIEGSPYLEKEFVSGFIYNDSQKQYYGFQLRYNVYNDEIEIHNIEDNSVSALLKNPDYSCTMHNRHFKYIQFNTTNAIGADGYFIELNKGKMKLLMKYNCKYSSGKPSLNSIVESIPPSFKISKKYYVQEDDSIILLPTRKKKILELFDNYDNEVDSYIKKNKLNVKEERDITRIISYYNSIQE